MTSNSHLARLRDGCTGLRTQLRTTHRRLRGGPRQAALSTALLITLATTPAAAQSTGAAFCDTALAGTIQNMFAVIQFGGPLIGGLVALGATVALPTVRRSDYKQELKRLQKQGLIWGVCVASLGTATIRFLLNNVVVGGASCGF